MEPLWNRNYCKVMMANFLLFAAFYLFVPLLPIYLSDQFGATKDVIGTVLSLFSVTAGTLLAFALVRTLHGGPFGALTVANSTLLISWDIGMGLGMLGGGLVAEFMGYGAAFWTVVGINLAGVLTYFVFTQSFFRERNLNPSVG